MEHFVRYHLLTVTSNILVGNLHINTLCKTLYDAISNEGILCTVHYGVLDPKLTLFTDEAWFHLSGYINAQNNRYWSSINLRDF
jgi:hypothetical protein